MSRTAAGLVAVARRLTGPMPGIHHAVGPSPRRFATRAFERLGGDCHDLDMLARALDRLPGLPELEDSPGSRDLHRLRAPRRAAAPQNGPGAAPAGSLPVGSSDRLVAGQPRTRQGRDATANSAAPLGPERVRPVASIPMPGSTVDLPDGHRPQPAGAGSRPGEGTAAPRDLAGLPALTSGLGRGRHESESRPSSPADSISPIAPDRAASAGPARAERSIANDVARPADEVASAGPVDFSGALGDFLRRSGVRELPVPAGLAPTNGDTVRPAHSAPPEMTRPSGAPRAPVGVPTAAVVIEAFEMALDKLVRREAERHGLESEL